MAPIYVTGHVNPDTDSIASAMGYSWLLRNRDGMDTVAARAGALNPQTVWVLKRLQLDAPILLTDASPKFESVTRRLDSVYRSQPLRDAWAISIKTGGITPVLNNDGTPFGLITGRSLFKFLTELIGPNPQQQEVKISKILESNCELAADAGVVKFQAGHRIRDALQKILREEGDEFWAIDENGMYVGICRQRDLLNPPRMKLILVDHNEPQQAIPSLEEADLLEVLDHHRLGNQSTRLPIRFTVDVVGSTSTLVFERIIEAGLSAPYDLAGMLLAGLLSDTLILSSPTTTLRDKEAAERLARWAFSPNTALAGENIVSFGEKLLTSGAGLQVKTANEIVSSDLKLYKSSTLDFSISQMEVTDLYEMEDKLTLLSEALDNLRKIKSLDFSILMVTDVVRSSSRLLLINAPPELDDLPFTLQPDGTLLANGIVSRKKQLLPVVLGLLED